MSYLGGYNIINLSRFGEIPVPGNITVTDSEMEKFSDMDKPTFFAPFEVFITSESTTHTNSGFLNKFISAGVESVVAVPGVLISKTGDNQLTFALE